MSARAYFVSMFPQGPQPFAHPSTHLEEALALLQLYQISSVGSCPFHHACDFLLGFFLLFRQSGTVMSSVLI
jgi:hypothetical protein